MSRIVSLPGVIMLLIVGMTCAPSPVTAQPSGESQSGVQPFVGPEGTRFAFFATGFMALEPVGVWLNAPDGRAVRATVEDLGNTDTNGYVDWFWTARPGTPPGAWQMVALGLNSGVERVIAFQVSPTQPAGPLPPITAFSSARFDLQTSTQVGAERQTAYGGGEVVRPDQVYTWLRRDGSEQIVQTVQIGADRYVNAGTGWQPAAGELAAVILFDVPLDESLARLSNNTDAILYFGNETVRGVPTVHYQIWLSGQALLDFIGNLPGFEAVALPPDTHVKIDLWVGVADQLLYQQGNVVMIPTRIVADQTLPEIQIQTLITYYDFNDPSIVVVGRI